MQPIRRSQLVSVLIPANASQGARIAFPDIPELRDALVDGLEVYNSDELSIDPQGNTVVTSTQLTVLSLNLLEKSDRRGADFPAFGLLSSAYGGIWKEFTGWNLNWQKCTVQVTQNGAFGAAASLPVNVFYHYPEGRRL